ncbi:DUF1538 domain-containing protein [Kaarinaea lacus]
MEIFHQLLTTTISTMGDIAPIIGIIFGFQVLILKQPIPNIKRVTVGIIYVLAGLSIFLVGLEQALFPLGKIMATQLTDPQFIQQRITTVSETIHWQHYYWVYIFAFTIGFSTTVAEPALIAVALKAHAVSGGAVGVWGLRIAVGLGVALGIALGTFRIISGTPLHYYIIAGYILVIIQTFYAPRMIIALAYDSGGVTTSTVTVPLVAALGLGLASTVPGRSVLLDGFGLIAFASLFPMITVMAYAQFAEWRAKKSLAIVSEEGEQ